MLGLSGISPSLAAHCKPGRPFGVIWWGTDCCHLSPFTVSSLEAQSIACKCANWWLEAMNACPRTWHSTAAQLRRSTASSSSFSLVAALVRRQSGKLSKSSGYDYDYGHFPLSYWPPNLDISKSEHFLFHYPFSLCSSHLLSSCHLPETLKSILSAHYRPTGVLMETDEGAHDVF